MFIYSIIFREILCKKYFIDFYDVKEYLLILLGILLPFIISKSVFLKIIIQIYHMIAVMN